MSVILGRRDLEPYICGVCGRSAGYLGYMPSHDQKIMWLCEDDECISYAKWVYEMKNNKLNYFEQEAVRRASNSISTNLIDLLLFRLWNTGFKDLDNLDASEFQRIIAEMTDNNQLNDVLTKFLIEYSNEIKAQIINHDIPF